MNSFRRFALVLSAIILSLAWSGAARAVVLSSESFEGGGFTDWVNVAGDNCDWQTANGPVNPTTTGPNAAQDGSWYAYIRTATGQPCNNNKTAYLESPNINADIYAANVNFYWHMYGTQIGSLYLDVWNGASWVLGVWSISGNQGNTWFNQVVDLSAYSGTIKLRFRVISGGGVRSETALDNIIINGTLLTPIQSSWSPVLGSIICSTSPTVTFNLDKNGDCKWSLNDLDYIAMAGDCTGDGTMNISCAMSGLIIGAATAYTACSDTANHRDIVSTNTQISYTIDTSPPTQSNWNPAKGSTIYTSSPTATLSLNKVGDCKWSLTDQAYGSMSGDCTGDGTTAASCAASGLPSGAQIVYIACRDACGNADTAATNEHVDYTVDLSPPTQSNWNPAKGSTIYTQSPTITLTLNRAGDCKWGLTDLGYSAMAGDCTGDGTTAASCATSGLPKGAATAYISCRDTYGNADTAATNETVNYTVDIMQPYEADWWNPSWAYRVPLTITKPSGYENARYARKFVDLTINFASLGFDNIEQNSVRLVRYNGSSWVEMPSSVQTWTDNDSDTQYDQARIWFAIDQFDLATAGQPQAVYYLYFDIVSNGAKTAPSYSGLTNLSILCLDNDNESQVCEELSTYAGISLINVSVSTAAGLNDLTYNNLMQYDQLYLGWNAVSNDMSYQFGGYEADLKNYVNDGGRILSAASDNAGWASGWLPDPGSITVIDSGDSNPNMFAPFTTEVFAFPNANALNGITEDEDFRNVNGAGWEIMAQDTGTAARKIYLRKYWGAGLYMLSSVDGRNAANCANARNYFKNSIYWGWRYMPQPLNVAVGAYEWYTPDAIGLYQSNYTTDMTTARVGDTMYIQVAGDDMHNTVTATMNVKVTSTSDPTGINVTLTETAPASGIFRGTAVLAAASNDTTDQIAADRDNVVTVTSVSKLEKTDTLTVVAQEPSAITELDLKTDGTYSQTLVDTVDIGATLFIQVLGTDSNPLSTDSTTVTITSTIDSTGISVTLYETARNSGIYRGTATVANNSDDALDYINAQNGNTITVRSNNNPAYFDTCLVKSQPPTSITSVTIYEMNYTTHKTTGAGGESFYIEVVGTDGNQYTTDRTTVNVKSSATDPAGIGVQVVETGARTGRYRGFATLKASSNDPADQIGARTIDETVMVTSDDDPTKTDTLTVTNTAPTAITSVILKTDGTFTQDLTADLTVGATLYIEIMAADTNADTRDTTTVNVKSSVTDTTGISVILTQTTPTSSIFRGTATIKAASNDPSDHIGANVDETVTITSITDPAKTDTVNVISTNPTTITSTTFMSNGSYSAPLAGTVSVGDNLYIEAVATDLNPESRDTTTVYVTSTSDPTGVTVQLTESGNNTGEFDGVAFVSSASNDVTDEIEGTNGGTITAKSTVDQAKLDTVGVVGTPPRGIFSLNMYQSNYTTLLASIKGGDVMYIETRGVDGNTATTDKCTVTITSTSDPVGITVSLDEQASGTEFDRPYRGTVTARNVSDQNNGYIKVVAGDTVTITSQNFVYRLNGGNEFWMEGEGASRLTPGMTISNGTNTSGGQYVYVPQGTYTGAAEYVVYKDTAGSTTYYLYGRMYPENAGGNQFFTRMDNGGEAWWSAGTTYGTWNNPWSYRTTFALAQGAHVVRIRNTAETNDAVRMDKLVLKPAAGAPSGYGSDPVINYPADTVNVTNTPPSVVAAVVLKTDGTYTTDLITSVEANFPLYIQLQGTDGDAYTVNTTTVNVKSSVTDPVGISVTLAETGINTGVYRGAATVKLVSNDASDEIGANGNQTITITSNVDPSKTDTVVVDTAAALSVDTITAAPTDVNRGQQNIAVTMTVDNSGTAAADVTAADLFFTNDADFTVTPDGGNPAQIAGGAQDVVFTFSVSVSAVATLGLNTIDGNITADDALTGANASDSGAQVTDQWNVRAPGALTATLSTNPATVNTNQQFTVTMNVQNTGGNTVTAVAPSALSVTGAPGAVLVSGPSPASANIVAGGQQNFTWTYLAGATAGTIYLQGNAAGTDTISGQTVTSNSSTSNDVIIQTPAALTAAITASPTSVNQGENIVVTMRVTNTGGAIANSVAPGALTLGGTSTATKVTGPTPANSNIPGGGYVDYTWNYQAGSQNGTVNFTGGASGTDANSGGAVTATNATSNNVSVQLGCALSAVIAIPATLSTSQNVTVTMTVTNTGESGCNNVSPSSLTLGGTSSALLVSGPTPSIANIAGGAQKQYTWTYAVGTGSGTLNFTGEASGSDALNGAAVSSSNATSNTAAVQIKASLMNALVTVAPSTVNTGQTITVTMTVSNFGQATANNVTPSALALGGTSTATKLTGPTPASQNVPGGTQRTFTWTYAAAGAASGTVNFAGNSTGADANSGQAVISGVGTSSNVTIQQPAALTSSISGAPATVNTGQTITVTMTVNNTGQAYANAVAPSALTLGGTATATKASGPTPANASIPGGGQQQFTWTYTAGAAAGTVNFTGSAAGTDANTGGAVSSTSNASNNVNVQIGGVLNSSISIPATRNTNQSFTVSMTVTNTGASTVNTVAPSTLTLGGTSSAVKTSGPTPASANITGGGQQVFTWTYTAGASAGTLDFTGNASGTDAISGLPVSSTSNTSNTANIQAPAALVATVTSSSYTVNVNQTFTITLTVNNTGQETANVVTPAEPIIEGTGTAVNQTGPTPSSANIAGGGQQQFTWTYKATITGWFAIGVDAAGTGGNSGGAAASNQSWSSNVTVQNPAVLTASIAATPGQLSSGQTITVSMTVTNQGQTQADVVAPSALTKSGAGSATLASGPTPANATIAGGGQQVFTWTYTAGATPGTVNFTGSASGTDHNTSQTVNSNSDTSNNVLVQTLGALTVTLQSTPVNVNTGGTITVTMNVTNTGGASVNTVAPSTLTLGGTSGQATKTGGPTPASQNIPGSSTRSFTWTYTTGVTTGTINFTGSASGTEANTGLTVSSSNGISNNTNIQGAASLTSSIIAAPQNPQPGAVVTITMTVNNVGGAAANNVAPSVLTLGGTSTANYVSGPTPATWTITGGQQKQFTWTYTAGAGFGTVNFSGNTAGTDANSGAPVSSGVSTSNTINITGLSPVWVYPNSGNIGPVRSSASVRDDIAYIGSDDDVLYAINANTGSLSWNRNLGGDVVSTPFLYYDGVNYNVYIGSSSNYVYALDAANVKLPGWPDVRVNIGNTIVSTTVADGSNIYFGCYDQRVYAVSMTNGGIVWTSPPLNGSIISSPAVSDTAIYIGSTDGKLYALSIADGTYLRSFDTGGSVEGSPWVDFTGKLFIGSASGKFFKLSASNFAQDWVYPASGAIGGIVSSPWVEYYGVNGVYFGADDGKVYGINATTGLPLAGYTPYQTGNKVRSSPMVWNNIIYVGSDDGKVYAFNATTGALLPGWPYDTTGVIFSSPGLHYIDGINDRIIIGTDAGKVYSFETN